MADAISLEDQIEELKRTNDRLEKDFGVKRAKFMELFKQKEGLN
jgi:hypothetical protein